MHDDRRSPIPEAVLRAFACATPEAPVPIIEGFDIRAMPSHRGETRVWYVRRFNPHSQWYVKRLREPEVYRRYLEGLRSLERIETRGSDLIPVRWAGQDESSLLVATHSLRGISARDHFVSGTRWDKLLSWASADIDGLARQLSRGFRALWGHTCAAHPDLLDYGPHGTADRIIQKSDRLREVVPDTWRRLHATVARVACALESIPCPNRSLLLGDVTLDNLLLSDRRVGIFDLEDIGTGDWRRDVSCLVQRLADVEENVCYSTSRIRRFRRSFLAEVGLEPGDRVLGMYRLEFYLDMLWSSLCHQADKSLPIPTRSSRMVERLIDRHLERVEAA